MLVNSCSCKQFGLNCSAKAAHLQTFDIKGGVTRRVLIKRRGRGGVDGKHSSGRAGPRVCAGL